MKFSGKTLSYVEARRTIFGLSQRKGLAIMSDSLTSDKNKPILGKKGESLYRDAIFNQSMFGEKTPKTVVMVMAGIHGAEAAPGFLMLCELIEEMEKRFPPEIGFVLVTPNPYGFSYNQRGGEDGADVNRSCSFPNSPTPNLHYDDLKYLVEPKMLNWDIIRKIQEKVSDFPGGKGWAEIQQKVICGQYHSPQGLFYGTGGGKLCRSGEFVKYLCENFLSAAYGVENLFALDLHMGLGKKSSGTILSPETSKDSAMAVLIKKWFGDDGVNFPNAKDNNVSGAVQGDILSAITRWLPMVKVVPVALEMGTTSPLVSFPAKVGKMWLKNHPDKVYLVDSKLVEKIQEDYRLTFAPIEDGVWMEALRSRFFQILDSAVKGLLEM
ncbi:MAG: DUF2817 domain-containing protein [bacterium]|nr:DUF2817 domain-containing protein [bacterium]